MTDLEKFKEYLRDEQERLAKVKDDDFLKGLLANRCLSYEKLILELEKVDKKELTDV